MSSLTWLLKEYVERRNGRIGTTSILYLFIDAAGRHKRATRRAVPFPEKTDEATGRQFAAFYGRGMKCHHPDKWLKIFPRFSADGKARSYFVVPQKDCRSCEFHEPSRRYGRKRYPSCRWFRENSGLESPLGLVTTSLAQAQEILK